MDAQYEKTNDLRRELLDAFEDLSRLAHHRGGNGADEMSLVATALLERLRQLCQASRAALILMTLSRSDDQGISPLSSPHGKVYRSLALSGIEEQEVYALLTSVPVADTVWTTLPAPDMSWLVWRLPLVLSFSSLRGIGMQRQGQEESDDAFPALQACFLFGWEQQSAEQHDLAVEQGRQHLSPLADAVGVVLVQVLTHEHIRDLEMRTDRRALREMELLKAELLASVSHELRSPLTSIQGYASTLLRHERRIRREERHEFLLAINEASDRLAGVIETLFEMSELETGSIEIERAPVDLASLVREALATAERRVDTTEGSASLILAFSAPKQLTFQLLLETTPDDAADQHLIIQADRNKLREVLDHLLDNAIKHTPTGGTIRLLVRLVCSTQDLNELPPFSQNGRGRLAQALQHYQRMAVISIQDSGKGIPHEVLERIFDPFYRVDTRLTREVNGLGLGLAICQRIIDLHQGRIWAESQEGQGTTFLVCLPLDEKN